MSLPTPIELRHGELIRSKTAAAYLGMCERTLYRLAQRGQGPPRLRIGGCIFYRRADLKAWVEGLLPDMDTR
jgi:predicted DNA-binding transcriptional regulator AlpA